MKKDMDDVTEKLNVRKDEISSSDEQGNRNVEIIDISMEVKRWYSFANLVYALLVGKSDKRKHIKTDWQYLRLDGAVYPVCSESGTAESKASNLARMAGCVCCIVCAGDCWCCGMTPDNFFLIP